VVIWCCSPRWAAEGNRSPAAMVSREGDPKGWSAVLITALGSVMGKPVPPRPWYVEKKTL
jgi:hypothetical protein